MTQSKNVERKVSDCLERFLVSSGKPVEPLTHRTNLHAGLGLSSDEGLDFLLDLCEEFSFEFPHDFNPVIHRTGNRGNSFGELVTDIEKYLAAAGVEA